MVTEGGNAQGEHAYTLTLTDIAIGWTENHSARNKARDVQAESNDPRFYETLVDVVGLYLNRRRRRSSYARTRNGPPRASPGHHPGVAAGDPGPRSDNDPRLHAPGTPTVFAALDVLTGTVIGRCLLGFPESVEASTIDNE